jgi:hypothetical protein
MKTQIPLRCDIDRGSSGAYSRGRALAASRPRRHPGAGGRPGGGHRSPRAQRPGRDGLRQLLASSARPDIQRLFRGAGTPPHLHDLGIPSGPCKRERSSPPTMAVVGPNHDDTEGPGAEHSAGHGRLALGGCHRAPFPHSPRVRWRSLLHANHVPSLGRRTGAAFGLLRSRRVASRPRLGITLAI